MPKDRNELPQRGGAELSLFFLLDHYPDRKALGPRYREHIERAVRAERLGFQGLFVAEHHFSNLGVAPNPAVFLAAVAARTERLFLGPAVAVLPFRHPLQVVEDYAMVDQLSDGRLVLGVGSGAEASEFEGFGLDVASKRELFEDRLAIVEAAFQGRGGAGESPNVRAVKEAGPPILIASTRVAGARAVGSSGFGLLTLASPATPSLDEVVARLQAYREGQQRRRGRGPHTSTVAVTVFCHLAEDAAQARKEAAPALGRFLKAHGAPEADGLAAYDDMLSRGVGAFGTPEEVARTLAPLVEAGVEHFVLWMGFGDLDGKHFDQSMTLAPRLRELLHGFAWRQQRSRVA
ncbi:MAG: LLM class flavin-dependent oxidoreductase [Acidobacteriota bacterium]